MSFSDCKSKCGFFLSIEILENAEEHKAKEINIASRIPGDACFLCFIVFCGVSCVRLLFLFFKQKWVTCHICGSLS